MQLPAHSVLHLWASLSPNHSVCHCQTNLPKAMLWDALLWSHLLDMWGPSRTLGLPHQPNLWDWEMDSHLQPDGPLFSPRRELAPGIFQCSHNPIWFRRPFFHSTEWNLFFLTLQIFFGKVSCLWSPQGDPLILWPLRALPIYTFPWKPSYDTLELLFSFASLSATYSSPGISAIWGWCMSWSRKKKEFTVVTVLGTLRAYLILTIQRWKLLFPFSWWGKWYPKRLLLIQSHSLIGGWSRNRTCV